MMEYRILYSVHELQQVVDLELVVWGLNPRDAVPMYVMHAATQVGGLTLGAFDGERMVGMAFAFVARRGNEYFLWSHMTGVHPDYQGKGVGYELKLKQRSWALEQGYRYIRWTFDPLQRGNAHFNIARLGTTANVYYEDFYGAMDDDINRGMPSDRIEAEWNLMSQKRRWVGEIPPPLIRLGSAGMPRAQPPRRWDFKACYVPLPLTPPQGEERLAWRMAVRTALQEAFAAGYRATDFLKQDDTCGYVLERLG